MNKNWRYATKEEMNEAVQFAVKNYSKLLFAIGRL
jgi:hypothetical protein